MNKELICIVCPRGCRLLIDEATLEVQGNFCPRGSAYAKQELTNPTRTLTSTVVIESKKEMRLPVKSDKPLPKGKISEVMRLIDSVKVKAPIYIGDIVLKNVLDLDVNIVATKEILE